MRTSSSPIWPTSNKGFTLIEVVLAVFIAVIVVVAVNASFYRSQQVMKSVQEQAEVYQMGRMALDRITKDLTCAYLPQLSETASTGGVDADVLDQYRFIGKHAQQGTTDTDSLYITTTGDLGLSEHHGLVGEVDYYLKEVEQGKGVYYLMRREDALPHAGITTGGTELELAEDVSAFNIVFVDENGTESEDWDLEARLRLPTRVKVTLTFKRGDKEYPFTGVATLPLAWIKVKKATGG